MAPRGSAGFARLAVLLPAIVLGTLSLGGKAHAATIQNACGAAPVGQVRCDAQILVSRHRPLHPRVKREHALAGRARLVAREGGRIEADSQVAAVAEPSTGSPAYFQQAYDLTALAAANGGNKTIGVVDAYSDPTIASDLATFRATFGLPACTTTNGCLQVINQLGLSTPLPAASQSWSVEESLDLDAVSSLCPNCKIVLVEAEGPSTLDMQQAVDSAVLAGANVVSNSWSGESTTAPFTSNLVFPGVSLVAASGDSGTAPAGESNYPAALPSVTAVGGTELSPSTTQTPRGFSETAWNDGGSGCDLYESVPSWQSQTGCNGRAYSDLSADADPDTGLDVYDSQGGGWIQAGGTSLAAPLVAAYEAITGVNESTPQWAYQDAPLLNDVTSGSNGSCSDSLICNAGVGWDGPTGVGSISGAVVSGAPGIGGPDVSSASGNSYTVGTSATGAELAGGVYPNSETTSYYWQYGTTTAYGSQTTAASVPAGSSVVGVQDALASLAPATTYHYRLVASNASGTSYGYDFTFATTAAASGLTTPAHKTVKPAKHKKKKKQKKKAKHKTVKGAKHHKPGKSRTKRGGSHATKNHPRR